MFEVKVAEVSLVVHARFEPLIHGMKLNDGVIYAVEACLVCAVEPITVTHPRPWRNEDFISAASYKPICLDFSGEYLDASEDRSPIEKLGCALFREAFYSHREPAFQLFG